MSVTAPLARLRLHALRLPKRRRRHLASPVVPGTPPPGEPPVTGTLLLTRLR